MEDAVSPKDLEILIRDKYKGDRSKVTKEDRARIAAGEPLAYIIGHLPFLGLSLRLDSLPLIPRPETEWWTEELANYIKDRPLSVLDLCAGSGAIGLSLLSRTLNTRVSFGELIEEHTVLIEKNLSKNGLSRIRADIRTGDLFAPFAGSRFDIIATNPPYILESRALPESVSKFEPKEALYGGVDGLALIRRILEGASAHLFSSGELWMECDVENIEKAAALSKEHGAQEALIRNDQYGRPRLLVAYYR